MRQRRSPRFLRWSVAVGVAAGLIVSLTACGGEDSSGNTLTWFIFNEPSGAPQKAAEQCSQESNGRYKIEFEFLPSDADAQREQLVRRLGAEDDTIDIIGMDVIWTGEFANAGWIEPFTGHHEQAVSENVFSSVLSTARFEGDLYAAPIWSNTELLWYRSDRVERPPATWDEMIDVAEEIGPEKGRIQVQANRYEGLVVWVNAMIESAGTSILAGPEEIELEREGTERALGIIGRLSTSEVADPAITTSDEDAARLSFEEGASSFMINYPFVFPSAKENAPDVFKNMKAAKFPAVEEGTPSAPPLGGINLGVSAFSEHQELAFEAIECLIKPEHQLAIAEAGGLPPVREDLYSGPEIEKIYPGFSDVIADSIRSAAPRPSQSPAYTDLSLAIQRAIHPTTEIDPGDPAAAYDDLLELVEQAVAREGLL